MGHKRVTVAVEVLLPSRADERKAVSVDSAPLPLTPILERLSGIAAQRDPDFPASLQPGLSREALRAKLAEAGFAYEPPQEWFELYQWHNGSTSMTPLFYYHEFVSVEAALAEREEWDQGNRSSDFELFPANILPLFYFEGEFYGIECHAEPQTTGRIWFVFHDTTVCYDGLTSMLAAKQECYETGIYWDEDEDGYEEVADKAACAAILLKHNPIRAEMGLAAHYHP